METKDRNKIYYRLLLIAAIIIPVIIGFSYAYFLAVVKVTNDQPTVISGNVITGFDLRLETENDGYINATDLIPLELNQVEDYAEKGEFDVIAGNNPYNINYSISLTDITISPELKISDFKWKLICTSCGEDTSKNAEGNFASINTNTYLLKNNLIIDSNTTDSYKLILWIEETDQDQISLMNKSFSAKVTIEGQLMNNSSQNYSTNIININNIEELVKLSNDVNSGTTYEGTTFVLTRNLDFNDNKSYINPSDTSYGDLNGNGTVEGIKNELTNTTGKGFTPIGMWTNQSYFKGNFDGLNHRLDNIYINNSTESVAIGLFGVCVDCSIQNLILSGNIKSSAKSHVGLVGAVNKGELGSTFTNIINEANIDNNTSYWATGGILGGLESGATATISNSINKGYISNGERLGGLVGYTNGNLTIENSYNEGIITNTTGKNIGGLIGRDYGISNETRIINSYNKGNVVSNTSDNIYMGGLIGYISGKININNGYNIGLLNNEYTSYDANKDLFMGGLIGCIYSSNLENKISNSYNQGNIINGNRVGGIIGRVMESNILIDKSYNTGNLSTNIGNANANWSQFGGLIGGSIRSSITSVINSYNKGNISYNTDISTNSSGLVGYTSDSGSKLYIINSFNIGDIDRANTGGRSSGITAYAASTDNPPDSVVLNNVYNKGQMLGSNNMNYGIVYLQYVLPSFTSNNAYYQNVAGITASNRTISAIPKSASEFNSQTFVNELNTNKNSINLSSIDSALSDYALSAWKLGTNGYPIFAD